MKYEALVMIVLLLCLSGCAGSSRYPDTGRAHSAPVPAEVMQGLEATVEDILREQAAANNDVRELQQIKISTRQYYGTVPSNSAYTEARIDLLTEEDIAFAQEVLVREGYWDDGKPAAEAWKAAVSAYQAQNGLPVSGSLNGATIQKMKAGS